MQNYSYLCTQFCSFMKRTVSILTFLVVALSLFAQTEFTFSTASDMSQNKDGISLAIEKGTGGTAPTVITEYETGKPEMRVFLGNTITISGTNLTDIQLVCAKSSASNKAYAGMSANVGTLVSGGESTDKNDWKVDTWTGSATSVVFTLTDKGQRRIQRIVIGGDSVIIPTDTTILPTAEDLEPNYNYAEPTLVHVPDTQIFKKEFAFIDNNILVHCDMGTIRKATDTTLAYFNCNAGYTMTFTASQPIKGVAIDGFVRKDFEATCDHGTLQYLTDPDFDEEGWPALVILDVNNTSVTLSCPEHQFRCYGVKVYFQENPDPLYEGIETVQPAPKAKKIIRDGQLYIQRGNKLFNALGTQL